MNAGVIYPPYMPVLSERGAAPLQIAHAISILREECGVSDIKYVDFNTRPFYTYFRLLKELHGAMDIIKTPVHLFLEEEFFLVARVILEDIFEVPDASKTKDFFKIDDALIESVRGVLTNAMDDMVRKVSLPSRDALLVFTSPTITYTLGLLDLIRRKDSDIPILLLDNYTFEPATPYFAAFMTHKDYHGNNIEHILSCDPLSPILGERIPDLVDWIAVGEGYDVIRSLFNSTLGPRYDIKGASFLTDRTVRKVTVTQGTSINRGKGVSVLRSRPVDLDSLPLPDYGPMKKIYRSAEVELTRGCPYECIFCERSGMFEKCVRSHGMEYMDRLVPHLLDSYNFEFYTVTDSALNVNEDAAVEFLEGLEKGGRELEYQVNLRGKPPNARLVELLKSTGCKRVAIGMESGDEPTLKSMHKAQNIKILEELTGCIGANGLPLILFLIVGFPIESTDSINRTMDVIKSIGSNSEMDCVEAELYHTGHIQRLNPSLYDEYGIEWSGSLSMENVERSSRLFAEPGFSGLAYFTKGMDRFKLNEAIKGLVDGFADLDVRLFICPPFEQSM
jgi:hypothetical protein